MTFRKEKNLLIEKLQVILLVLRITGVQPNANYALLNYSPNLRESELPHNIEAFQIPSGFGWR